MKSLVIFALLVMSPLSFAARRNLVFELHCHWSLSSTPEPRGAPSYTARKTAFKKPNGKWDVSYSLIVAGKEYELTSARSGDEDYNEFNVVDPQNEIAISSAAIQNAFEWVALHGDNQHYDCR